MSGFGTDVRAAFSALAAGVEGVRAALDHEPANVPKDRPAVTMLIRRQDQADRETGPTTDLVFEWSVRLYVPLRDYAKAQDLLEEIGPRLLAITAENPRLGGACEWAELTDSGEDPTFAHDDGWLLKRFLLTARGFSRPPA